LPDGCGPQNANAVDVPTAWPGTTVPGHVTSTPSHSLSMCSPPNRPRQTRYEVSKAIMRYQAAALLLLLAACEGPMEPDDRWAVPEEIEFAAALDIDLDSMNRTQSGLYWEDL